MTITAFGLFLHDFEVLADIGVHDFEIGNRQRVLIDVDMTIDGSLADHADELETTVDYDFVRSGIMAMIAKRRFNTQETLCMEILRLVFTEPRVSAATVKSRKLDVYPDAKAVGCVVSAASVRSR